MDKKVYTVIVGTGSYIPTRIIPNEYFMDAEFYDPATSKVFETNNAEIIRKFQEITNIEERRYADSDQVTSDLATFAARDAIETSGIDPETFEFILVAHNFGDVVDGILVPDQMPSLANRVKAKLGIRNPSIMTNDVACGCPGWTTAMIIADAFIKSRTFKRGLVIGADVLSRIADPYDRDRMIFSDGAGAVIVEAVESEKPVGILSQASRSDFDHNMLMMGCSANPDNPKEYKYLRMLGSKVYAYALSTVPGVVKESLDKAGLHLDSINKVLIHQANEKMDEAILSRVFKLYGKREYDKNIMPMTIQKFGNSSTATVPTLLDLVLKDKMDDHQINKGDIIILASVGAGMTINSIVYKMPD
ncbi:MAG: ketoacyl-ACP synthase III [Mariniphaga sp.]